MDQTNQLWNLYRETKTKELWTEIVEKYSPLVKVVAGGMVSKYGRYHDFDDLVGYGVFGLLDAIDKYDPAKDVKFEAYASTRIRGSIVDNIRKMDWAPRSVRSHQKDIEKASNDAKNMGIANEQDYICSALGISSKLLQKWQSENKTLVSYEQYMENNLDVDIYETISNVVHNPETMIEKEEIKKMLAKALSKLTENQLKVITLCYYEDLSLKEISGIMGVCISRASQLHIRALEILKKTLIEEGFKK